MIYKELMIFCAGNWYEKNLPTDKAMLFKDFLKRNNDFTDGVVIFKKFTLKEYPNQEEAYALVEKTYKNEDNEYYWCGTKYETLEDIFDALNEQKMILEITVNY